MADTNEAPESRTLLLRRIAQLEDDLAETRGCIVRLASVIETLLIDGPQPAGGTDVPDSPDWVAPVIPLEPGRVRQEGAAAGPGRASRPLPPGRRDRGQSQAPSNWGSCSPPPERSTACTVPSAVT